MILQLIDYNTCLKHVLQGDKQNILKILQMLISHIMCHNTLFFIL